MMKPYFWFASMLADVLIVCCVASFELLLFTFDIVLLLLLLLRCALLLWLPSQLKLGDCFSSNGLRLLDSDACN